MRTITKTTTDKIIEQYKKLGFYETSCYKCVFLKRESDEIFGSCTYFIAQGIYRLSSSFREANKSPNSPAFPVLYVNIGDTEKEDIVEIPAIIASQVGIASGSMMWPERFDPVHILLCMFYDDSSRSILKAGPT